MDQFAAESAAILAAVQEELAIQDADIAEKKAVVEEMIANIMQKSEIANKQEAAASEKKILLEAQNIEITVKKEEADAELAVAQPIMIEA